MAAVTNAGVPGRVRRVLMNLVNAPAHEWIAEADEAPPAVKRRRYYPPKRDRVIEEAAMSREMYRL